MAKRWIAGVSRQERIAFCRVTQIGFLRLLTTQAIMKGEVKTQREAWITYQRFFADPRITIVNEPRGLEAAFQRLSNRDLVAPKSWNDDYLIAFAETAGLSFITFDKAASAKSSNSVLLT